jgi:hypothetical protein
LVFVKVDPSEPTDTSSQAQARIEWVLRREKPDRRKFILQAVAKDPTIGVDTSALRHALELSPPQIAVLRYGFFERPLRRLIAEEPPFQSSRAMVVDALVQDVSEHCRYLSIHDVQAMVTAAAIEIRRRTSEDENSTYPELLQIAMSRTGGYFTGRTWGNDPWLIPRRMFPIEMHVIERLEKVYDGLPALRKAPARWLDMLIYQVATADVEQLSSENKHLLMVTILHAYEKLLSQCFEPGKPDESGPHAVHDANQHHVRFALDRLGFPEVPVVGTPTPVQLQRAGMVVNQPASPPPSKKRPAQEIAVIAPSLSLIEQPQEQARAGELHAVAEALARMTAGLELQQGLRCLQHAFNNAWSNWVCLHRSQMQFRPVSLPNAPQELDAIDHIRAPDGFAMQRLRLMPEQLYAVMPALEAHLDLAIVFKGATNLRFMDARVHDIKHYTALIKVNDLHFELESNVAVAEAGKRWIRSLPDYFKEVPGGAYMAIPGDPAHPLSKYLTLLAIEPFWRTCEALGVLLKTQPIIELAQSLPVNGMREAAHAIDARSVAAFCRKKGFSAACHVKKVAALAGRSKEIVEWLDDLGKDKVILWTGTDPMVMAVTRNVWGDWMANVSDGIWQRPLIVVLDEQQSLFADLPDDERERRAGIVEALVLEESSPARVRSADQPPGRQAIVLDQPPPAVNLSAPTFDRHAVQPQTQASVRPAITGAEARSEQRLLSALRKHPYTQTETVMSGLNNEQTIKTTADVVDYLSKVAPRRHAVLLSMAKSIRQADREGSEHVATLFALHGRGHQSAEKYIPFLPPRIPPCLVPYTVEIKANIEKWKNGERKNAFMKQLGL